MSNFCHFSKNIPRTKEERKQFYYDRFIATKHFLRFEREKNLSSLLLDSSLISQTERLFSDIKIIQCGDYFQVYKYKKPQSKKIKKDNKIINTKGKEWIYTDYLVKKENYSSEYSEKNDLKEIEDKNIRRSKFQLQRLVKTNEKEFKTFITLTFSDNVTDISQANKVFNSFRTYIKKLKSDFKYVCVPEFQKRGAVHYHLLTNIDYTDFDLLSQTEVKLWSPKSNKWQVGRNIVGWSKGFTLVVNMNNVNVVGYLSKYMTKDIDNRLWGKRRYLYSQNLKKPCEILLNLNKPYDFMLYFNIVNNNTVNYKNDYLDAFGDIVQFCEYKKIDLQIANDSPSEQFVNSDNIYYVNLHIKLKSNQYIIVWLLFFVIYYPYLLFNNIYDCFLFIIIYKLKII